MSLSLTKEYFQAFSNKNVKKLEELFAENIYLKDWESEVLGFDNVIKFMKKLFKDNDLQIQIKEIYCDNNTVIAEIKIFIESNNFIKVVDIIEFNDSKIVAIRAYKG